MTVGQLLNTNLNLNTTKKNEFLFFFISLDFSRDSDF